MDGEKEGATLIGPRLKPDATAMVHDDALADGQPDTGAGIFFGSVLTTEQVEHIVFTVFDADAVVGHRKFPHTAVLPGLDANGKRT